MNKFVSFALVVVCAAYSHSAPIDHEAAIRASESRSKNFESGVAIANESNLLSADKFRSALYPLSGGGYGYQPIMQSFGPVPQYPNVWAYPQPAPNTVIPQPLQMSGRNIEEKSFLKPTPVYYSTPPPQQTYNSNYNHIVSSYSTPQAGAYGGYSSPYTGGYSSPYYYGGYSSPYYGGYTSLVKSTKDDKPRTIGGPLSYGSQGFATNNSPVQYKVQYLFDKPENAQYDELTGAPALAYSSSAPVQSASDAPSSVSYRPAVMGRDADERPKQANYRILPNALGFNAINDLRGQGIAFDGQSLDMKIMPDYMAARVYPYMIPSASAVTAPSNIIAQQPATVYAQAAAAHVPSTIMQSSYYGKAGGEERVDKMRLVGDAAPSYAEQDQYVSPGDHVYMEPMPMSPDPISTTGNKQQRLFRAAADHHQYYEQAQAAEQQRWNAAQQLAMAEIQRHYANALPSANNNVENRQREDGNRPSSSMQSRFAQLQENTQRMLQEIDEIEKSGRANKEYPDMGNAAMPVENGAAPAESRSAEEKETGTSTKVAQRIVEKMLNGVEKLRESMDNAERKPVAGNTSTEKSMKMDEKKSDEKISAAAPKAMTSQRS